MSLIEESISTNRALIDTSDVGDVLFGIKERPLVYFENGGGPTETDFKVLLNDKTNEVLYMGKIYSPIHNKDIVETVSEFSGLELARVRNYYGKRFEFTYTLPDTNFKLGAEETMFSLNIVNSYDGSTSLHVVGGLYVLVCTNGAKIGRLTYQFKRRHTSYIGMNELKGFIQDSIEYINERSYRVAGKEWSDDQLIVKDKFDELSRVFPERKDQQLHQGVIAMNSEYLKMSDTYPEQKEFALFMAVTNMTTRPGLYGLSPSYTKSLDNILGNIFFN